MKPAVEEGDYYTADVGVVAGSGGIDVVYDEAV